MKCLNSRKAVYWFVAALLLAFSDPIYSQDPFQFEVGLSGLPTQMEGNMVRDHDGFLWFPYFGGIARYDGNEVKYFEYGNDTLSGASSLNIVVDNDGTLWILTKDAGLNSYDKKTNSFTAYMHDPDDDQSISTNQSGAYGSQKLFVDKHNRIFIATLQGMNIYDQSTGVFTRYKHDPESDNSISHNDVTSVIQDSDGIIWVGTNGGGLNRFDEKANKWTHYRAQNDNEKSLSSDLIWTILEDSEGYIWLGTWDKGLCRLDKESEIFTRYAAEPDVPGKLQDNRIQNLSMDKERNIWISHRLSTIIGLERYSPDEDFFYQYYPGIGSGGDISSVHTSYVFQDPVSDILWVINNYNGVIDKYDPSRIKFPLYKHYPNDPDNPSSLAGDLVLVMEEDNFGNILLSVLGGIDIVNPVSKEVAHIRYKDIDSDLGAAAIAWTWEDDSQLWVLNINGVLTLIDTIEWKIIKKYKPDENDPDSIMQQTATGSRLVKDKDDTNILWIGLSEGLDRLDIQKEEFTHFIHDPDDPESISQGAVWDIYDDGRGVLWISAIGGFSSFNKSTRAFKRYLPDEDDPSSIGFLKTATVFEDSFGNFWVGSLNGGFDLMDRENETFEHFNKSTGFPSSIVNQTFQQDSDGFLWIGTGDAGLVKFDPRAKEVIAHYVKKDGLQDNATWRSFKSESGQLWFGGGLGVNAFYPDDISENTTTPPVKLVSLSQGGESIALEQAPELVSEINLPWNENYFEFQFAVLNYSNPEKNEFAYMLEGWDKDWYYSGHNALGRYTGLTGGSYRLRLKGANNDGFWNEEGPSILINVDPPFWQSFQFRMLVISVIILFVAMIIWYIIKLRKEVLFRQKIQHELQMNKDHLEDLVEERTRELSHTNSQLELEVNERKEAEEAAKKANQAKSVFLANMSHEIRTPLNAVTGFSELLTSMVTDMKQKSYLDSIKTAGKSLLTLINDILDLSKIEAGQMEIQAIPMDLRIIIHEIEQIFAMKVHDKKLDFHVEVDNGIPETLILDETRIRQVLLNLVGNAVKFTDQGYVRVIANKIKDYGETIDLEIIVEDSGIGIPDDALDTIFQSFTQRSGQEYKKYGGTGLGLSITKRLTELMNGSVSVKSKRGDGSQFIVQLRNIVVSSEHIIHKDEKILNLNSIKFQKATVIVTDDIESNRVLFIEILKRLNLDCIEANNGKEALELVEKTVPDLVFMDLQMPVMNGTEATRALKRNPKTRGIPVIALTASTIRSAPEIIKDGGFDGFLSKPLRIESLLELLSHYLSHDMTEENLPDESESEILTSDADIALDLDIISLIKADFIPFLKSQQKALVMDEMTHFRERLQEVGEENGIEIFTHFAEMIGKDIHNFDIKRLTEKIEHVLSQFLKITGDENG